MRHLATSLVLASALALVAVAAAGESAPVLATRLFEQDPVSGAGYLAWAQNSRKHPKLIDAYARSGRGRPYRINRRYQAAPGSINGTTLVYQEFAYGRGISSIRFYDLRRRRQLPTPKGVNTRQWEWRPSVSGEWLLFSRNDGYVEAVILYNLRTRAQLELDRGRMRDDENFAPAGQVNGNFAVWTRCPRGRTRPCTVFRYDIAARTKRELPPPLGFDHFAPSVAADGTTYLVRHEPYCSLTELWRYPVTGEPAALLGPMPIGQGIGSTYVETRLGPNGRVNDVYHDRRSCIHNRSDLWRYSDTG